MTSNAIRIIPNACGAKEQVCSYLRPEEEELSDEDEPLLDDPLSDRFEPVDLPESLDLLDDLELPSDRLLDAEEVVYPAFELELELLDSLEELE